MVVFSKRGARGQLSFLRSAGVAFLSTRCVFQSALVIKHYAEKHTRPDTFDGPSLPPCLSYSNVYVAKRLVISRSLWLNRHTDPLNLNQKRRHVCCSQFTPLS